jgi:hypothetical protein
MTAAGVQNIDSAAYVPPSPSTSTPDAKGTGATGRPASDPKAAGSPSQPSDFQNELQLQQTDKSKTDPADRPKSGPAKSGSGKLEKKQDTRQEEANPAVATPVQVADPQKQILPFALALAQPQPQENLKLDENAKDQNAKLDDARVTSDLQATAKDARSEHGQQVVPASTPSAPAGIQFPELRQSAAPKQPAKLKQSSTTMETQSNPAANVAPSETPDSFQPEVIPFAAGSSADRQEGKTKSEDRSTQNQAQVPDRFQAMNPAKPGATSEGQTASRVEMNQSATPAGPVATAVQEAADAAPSSPSALAFAARVTAASQKADQTVSANLTQIPAVPGSQTPAQIPVRYAATAQIIQSTAPGNKEGDAKKGWAAAFDPSIRTEGHTDIRTDMVMPQAATNTQAPSASSSAAPPLPAPSAQLGRVIDPPAAPPLSSHDIRVRVPDNNGGSTQVRFLESGGEVRVSVRTADEGLAQSLRTHLNDLTQRLSDGGMPAEIWRPAPSAASSQNDQHRPQQDSRGSGGQGSSGQSEQQDRQQKRPAWLEEMEASLHAEQN